MEKVLVFGGAFNPPTISHRDVLKYAIDNMDFDLICVIPSSLDQQKAWKRVSDNPWTENSIREEMCKLNFSDLSDKVTIMTHEMYSDSRTSSYQSLDYIQSLYPKAEVYFLVGDDKVKQIPRWINAENLLTRFKFLVVPRNGDVSELINLHAGEHKSSFVELVGYEPMDISSTKARDSILSPSKDSGVITDFVINEIADIMKAHVSEEGEEL